MMQYEVYVNLPNNKAVGHRVGCSHAKVWGGETKASGGHMGPFDSKAEAETAAKGTGKPFHWCGHCEKNSE